MLFNKQNFSRFVILKYTAVKDENIVAYGDNEAACELIQPREDDNSSNAVDKPQLLDVSLDYLKASLLKHCS